MRPLALIALVACTGGPSATPPAPDDQPPPLPADRDVAASFTLRFTEPGTQYMEVEAVVPRTGDALDLVMATWTPGSYVIRDYARHVEQLSVTGAADGRALPVHKVATNRWTVDATGVDDVVVRYLVYAHDLGVRGNWVEPAFAVLNGAPTYIVPADRLEQPFDVRIVRPDRWLRLSTALPPHPSGEAHRFRAPDYDTLVDSPVLLGDSTVYTWTIADPSTEGREVPHRLVNEGEQGVFDGGRAAEDVERVSREIVKFWGGIPYHDYVFLNVISGARGGLEHRSSTLMTTHRWAVATRKERVSWLGLVSHELFHAWNVKRMTPAELVSLDYERPQPTRTLWIAEGLTSYYDDLLVTRAGIMTEDEYLERLSSNVKGVQDAPGRFVRSVEDASFDAWIKYYNRDENHDNVSVSYYTKGAVVGWMLDAEIRYASGGWSSLDDAMRVTYDRHHETGYTSEQFQAICEELAGTDLAPFFDSYVRGTEELDFTRALQVFGLRFDDAGAAEAEGKAEGEPGTGNADPEPGWLGVTAHGSGGRVIVSRVERGGPAWTADLLAGDEIIALNGFRVAGGLDDDLARVRPGETVELLVARRGVVFTTRAELGEAPDARRWTLKTDPKALIEARDTRQRWLQGLGGGAETGPTAKLLARPEPAKPPAGDPPGADTD